MRIEKTNLYLFSISFSKTKKNIKVKDKYK